MFIADDSAVFRSQIRKALEGVSGLEVVGTAPNGRLALQKLEVCPADVLVLDMEMPELDGLGTIREIRKRGWKLRIVLFSTHTLPGARLTLDGLALGADDFVSKPAETGGLPPHELIRSLVLPKVEQFAVSGPTETAPLSRPPVPQSWIGSFLPEAVVIGASTGGPQALERLLSHLPAPLRCPILVVQHMPPLFTAGLAERLGKVSGVETAEARQGEPVAANRIYVAPGDRHLRLKAASGQVRILLDDSPPRHSVRPAADSLFEAAAEIYGSHCAAFVLTGMGSDGLLGARAIRAKGGRVLIQDRSSSVVFGMPGAIFKEGGFDMMGGLEALSAALKGFVRGARLAA